MKTNTQETRMVKVYNTSRIARLMQINKAQMNARANGDTAKARKAHNIFRRVTGGK